MAKGYWVARLTIKDPEKYKAYTDRNGEAFAKFGGTFLVRGGAFETRSGAAHERHVVLEFDSLETAKACYDSPEYQAIVDLRDAGADVDLVIVEGV